MSGQARPVDSGRRDALGRSVKVTGQVAESRSSAPPPPAGADRTVEVAHDVRFLELMRAVADTDHRATSSLNLLRHYSDPLKGSWKRDKWHKNKEGWVGPDLRSDAEILADAKAMIDAAEGYDAKYTMPQVWDRHEADVAAAKAAHLAFVEHEAGYAGWSRFFLVTSSPGHIHSSMRCSTCNPSTTYSLVADLSAADEREAVDMFGEALCTVCYPSAPVKPTKIPKALAEKAGTPEFAAALAKHQAKQAGAEPGVCPGSGKPFAEGETRQRYRPCPACGKLLGANSYIAPRHKSAAP